MSLKLTKDLLEFLSQSPTPFHACENLGLLFHRFGFQELKEDQSWKIKPEGRYFVNRGGAFCAFQVGKKELSESGFTLFGAHTDSPCLKIRPQPETVSQNYFQLGVEVYGGVLLSTWFDRDLSIAGRVYFVNKDKKEQSSLVDFKLPVAVIPNLAIHLNREANESRSIQKQTELLPILCTLKDGKDKDDKISFKKILKDQVKASEILDYDLSLYDTQMPALVGLNQEFFTSARIDNLLSCYTLSRAVTESKTKESFFVVFNDHEEVGSASLSGAEGNFMRSILERITGTTEKFHQAIAKSKCISCDNAHGVHPNYPQKHDANHRPLLNKGPVLKYNHNQRYATNGETAAWIRSLCEGNKIPLQEFVARNDMGCGSTIGPITATQLGIRTCDIGVPTFAMHSIRETAGVEDVGYLYKLVQAAIE